MESQKKPRMNHSREFKIEAVQLALQGDRILQEVADNLGFNISNHSDYLHAIRSPGQ